MTQTPRKPTWRVTTRMRKHALELCKNMTRAERIIWQGLRAHRLNGTSFRRQTPIGPFIVDFVSHGAKLIIELDGGQHFEDAHEARDAARDAYLRSKEYRVLRFNNYDVMTNREGVLTTIAVVLGEAVTPSLPSPASGGGGTAAASVERDQAAGEASP
jgi:very-short-patch-repair endonuclease